MLRTAFAACIALAPMFLACGPGQPEEKSAGAAVPTRPHVFIYLVDTLRPDHLGVYGYDRPTSPRLDAFAREAVVFEDAWSTSGWTRPAVASLLTGLPPAVHGAVTRSVGLQRGAVSLAERLRAGGYRTAAFVTNPNVLPIWGFDRGFDAFYDVESVTRSARADRVNEVVFAHLEGLAQESTSAPLFVYIHTHDPHKPYAPPPPFRTQFDGDPMVAAYDGEIAFNDEQFGRLLDFLKERGLYDPSLIIFLSDHGEELNERGRVGHGHSLHEELVRIPLLMKLPKGKGGGRRITTPASLIDLVPTVLSRIGEPSTEGLEGIDLLAGDTEASGRPLFAALDLRAAQRRNVMAAVRMGHHKFVEIEQPAPETLLYDLDADPTESKDVSESHPALVADLERLLEEQRAQGEGGLQLWLVNHGDASPGEHRVEATLTTDGRLRVLRQSELEPGDTFELEPDGRRLHVRMTLSNRRNPVPPYRLVDRDGLVLALEPPSAELRFERLVFGNQPANLHLGRSQEPAGVAPFSLAADDAALRVQDAGHLMRGTRQRSTEAPAGAHLLWVPALRGQAVEVSPELDDRLRALGYAE